MNEFSNIAGNLFKQYRQELSRPSDAVDKIFHYTGIDNLTRILTKKKFIDSNGDESEKTFIMVNPQYCSQK